jgi:hypothetical protein
MARPWSKALLIGASLVAAFGAAVYIYYAAHHAYHPVARVHAPGGVTFTALLDARRGLKACTAAHAEFLDPVVKQCSECKVLFARCLDKAGALALALEGLEAAHTHWVVSTGVTIAVVGVAARAKASCEAVAADLARRGMRSRCVHPSAMNRI